MVISTDILTVLLRFFSSSKGNLIIMSHDTPLTFLLSLLFLLLNFLERMWTIENVALKFLVGCRFVRYFHLERGAFEGDPSRAHFHHLLGYVIL